MLAGAIHRRGPRRTQGKRDHHGESIDDAESHAVAHRGARRCYFRRLQAGRRARLAAAPPQTEPAPPPHVETVSSAQTEPGLPTTGPWTSNRAAEREPARSTIAPTPEPQPGDTGDSVDSTRLAAQVRDLEVSVADLQMRLMESEANAATLRSELDAAIREAVRSKAKLQSVDSRAEAASAIAEAEIAMTVRRESERSNPRQVQAMELLAMSTAEFENENYGGALYLAIQAKDLASGHRARLDVADMTQRTGEALFDVPLPLLVSRSSNVRRGPGTSFEILFVLEKGAQIIGHAHERQWVRITVADGRDGWIYSALVASRGRGSR